MVGVCIFRGRDRLESGIWACHGGPGGLGSHFESWREGENRKSEKGTRPGGCREGWWGRGKAAGRESTRGRGRAQTPFTSSQRGPLAWEAGRGLPAPYTSIPALLLTPAVSFPHLKSACTHQAASLGLQSALLSEILDDLCNKSSSACF